MGQSCSSTCGVVVGRGNRESDNLEMSRSDSPDPVMYDLMRKSIAATCAPPPSGSGTYSPSPASSKSNSNKRGRFPLGQHHLLYKQNPASEKGKNHNKDDPSGSQSPSQQQQQRQQQQQQENRNPNPSQQQQQQQQHQTINCTSTIPIEKPPQCPTRLLIRRRSLRLVEEGGGTHIYAIRYPEDTKDDFVSEQAQPMSQTARGQEQCPPSRSNSRTTRTAASPVVYSSSSPKGAGAGATTSNATATASSPSSSSKTKQQQQQQKPVSSPPVVDGGDVFTPGAMNSIPQQSGKFFFCLVCAVEQKRKGIYWKICCCRYGGSMV